MAPSVGLRGPRADFPSPLFLVLLALGCTDARRFHAAYLFSGEISDFGWSYTHNIGRTAAHRQMLAALAGDPAAEIKTSIEESLAPEAAYAKIEALVEDEAVDMIVAASFVFHDVMFEAARAFPNTDFVHVSGYYSGLENFATIHGRLYQARYVSGFVAGAMSARKRIGYVASVPIPEVYRGINAYYLGAQAGAGAAITASAVEHKVDVVVRWIGTFYDPVKEAAAAAELHALGCDVLAYHTDSVEVPKYAKEHGIQSVGSNADMRASMGESVLTSANYNWAPLFTEMMNRSYFGTFAAPGADRALFYGYGHGVAVSADPSFRVPRDVVARMRHEEARLLAGWDVFCLPVLRSGAVVNPGACLPTPYMLTNMTFTVDGVADSGALKFAGEVCGNGTSYTRVVQHAPPRITYQCALCREGYAFFLVPGEERGRPQECVACLPGTYAARPGMSACAPCPAGTTNVGLANRECAERIGGGLSAAAAAGLALAGVGVAAVIAVLAERLTRQHRAYEKLYGNSQVAADCAVAIASMRLEECDHLYTLRRPNQIQRAFIDIMDVLKEFRTYIPKGLVPGTGPGEDAGADVAIVFTDIRSSTALWEASPQGMALGLRRHNTVIRDRIEYYDGYEVKTIGDAFMVAFVAAHAAVSFGLAIQQDLVAAPWPTSLLEQPAAARSDDGAWNGIRIRVGINWGPAEISQDRGRLDYFGTVVNVAARVEAQCVPGAVCVTHAVVQALEGNKTDSVDGAPVEIDMGHRELYGIAGTVQLYLLVPGAMPLRAAAVRAELESRDNTQPYREKALEEKLSQRLEQQARDPESDSDSSTPSRGSRAASVCSLRHRRVETARRMTEQYLDRRRGAVGKSWMHRTESTVMYSADPLRLIQRAIDAIFSASRATNGIVRCVFGAAVVISWQVSPLKEAIAYTGIIADAFSTTKDWRVTSGLARGPMLVGNVGGGGQRFTTVLGPTLTLAELLCDACVALPGAGALCASYDGLPNIQAVRPFLRPVDTWTFGALSKPLIVYEVRPRAPAEPRSPNPLAADHLRSKSVVATDWGPGYWQAFKARTLASYDSDDAVVRAVARMQEAGGSLRPCPIPGCLVDEDDDAVLSSVHDLSLSASLAVLSLSGTATTSLQTFNLDFPVVPPVLRKLTTE